MNQSTQLSFGEKQLVCLLILVEIQKSSKLKESLHNQLIL